MKHVTNALLGMLLFAAAVAVLVAFITGLAWILIHLPVVFWIGVWAFIGWLIGSSVRDWVVFRFLVWRFGRGSRQGDPFYG